MTREQKLALIVGFALVLLVGILVSDHFSSARKARIAKIEPETMPAPAPVVSIPAPGPAPEVRVSPAAADPALQLILGSSTPATTGPTTPTPAPMTPLVTTPPAATTPLAAGPSTPPPGSAASPEPSTLREEINQSGGRLVKAADGTWDIHLPNGVINGQSNAPKTQPLADSRIEPLKTHVVKSGESLFQITAKYYGNGNLWKDVAKFNNMDKAGTIRPGLAIKIPSKDVLLGRAVAVQPSPALKVLPTPTEKKAAPKPATTPDRFTKPKIDLASYTVRKGDTLGEISLKTLGTSRRWQEIADLNNLDDEDAISAGTVLKIPAKRS